MGKQSVRSKQEGKCPKDGSWTFPEAASLPRHRLWEAKPTLSALPIFCGALFTHASPKATKQAPSQAALDFSYSSTSGPEASVLGFHQEIHCAQRETASWWLYTPSEI